MTEQLCLYATQRDEVLVAYLYDEMAGEERPIFERHLSICALCRAELDALAGVRTELQRWTVSGAPDVRVAPAAPAPYKKTAASFWSAPRTIPVWAQTAAAVFLFGAGLGLANLEVSYTAAGLSMQTGWRHRDAAGAIAGSSTGQPTPAATPAPASVQSDLARLSDEVRSVRERQTALDAASSAPGDEVTIRRVRALIQESEQRQQRELALRVAEVSRDVQTQRQADLVRIDRSLGIIQNRTGMEVMRTQQQMNSLAQRVSSQR